MAPPDQAPEGRAGVLSPVVGGVSGPRSEVEHRVTFEVEDGGFGRHEAVNNTELC